MSLFKSLLSKNKPLHSLLKAQNRHSLVLTKTLTSFPQIEPETKITIAVKKSVLQFFKEAVGLCEKTESYDEDAGRRWLAVERQIRMLKSRGKVEIAKANKSESPDDDDLKHREVEIIKSKPKQRVKENKKEERPKIAAKRLSSLFLNKKGGEKKDDVKRVTEEIKVSEEEPKVCDETLPEPRIFKDLSTEVEGFLRFLHEEGYFKNANFLPRRELDFGRFQDDYARNFIKSAAEQFGKDHQDIAKWLSGSDLKKVALFGCPSTARKAVFSAKRLRIYFQIPENEVCGKCVLKDSCKFVNQSVWKGETNVLNLATVMRVITLYATEDVSTKLIVPDDIKNSVNSLMKDVINLSQSEKSSEAVI